MPEFAIPEKSTPSIRQDPFVKGLLERLPGDCRGSFSDDQLLGLKVALAGRQWGRHAVDRRGSLGLWRWRYYYVFVCGRERRSLSRRQEELARMAQAVTLGSFLLICTLVGLCVLYLVKSALGIDLIPGYSLGLWDWFKGAFL